MTDAPHPDGWSEKTIQDVPEPVRRILEAMSRQALAQCERHGIAGDDFYRAMLEVQRQCPGISATELFRRTLRGLGVGD